MIRCLIFIRKLPHLTQEQFIDYYENKHAPLAAAIFPMYQSYTRRYVGEEMFGATRDNAYDVVTEITFATDDDLARWQAIAADPEVLARIRHDEANFLVSDATRMFFVDKRTSDG